MNSNPQPFDTTVDLILGTLDRMTDTTSSDFAAGYRAGLHVALMLAYDKRHHEIAAALDHTDR